MQISCNPAQTAAFLFGDDLHYLDHLLPLSNLLKIPLYTDREEIKEWAELYYPGSDCRVENPLELIPSLLATYKHIISCYPQRELTMYTHMHKNSAHFHWLPHGYSDKENLLMCREESAIFSYGKAFQKKILSTGFTGNFHQIGNYRASYFSQNHPFYENLKKEFCPEGKRIFLFAPTWEDYEKNSSIHLLDRLIDSLPEEVHLLIKLHPNTISRDPLYWDKRKWMEKRSNLSYIHEITTIYPLLDWVDLLITDLSSIAYDMLFFQKPIFFLWEKDQPKAIHKTGYLVKNPEEIVEMYRKEVNPFQEEQKALYKEVFFH